MSCRKELGELVELALEGRRRVKEQLKKMGSFEDHQTSFSLIDNETREEKFVGVSLSINENEVWWYSKLPIFFNCSHAATLRCDSTSSPNSSFDNSPCG